MCLRCVISLCAFVVSRLFNCISFTQYLSGHVLLVFLFAVSSSVLLFLHNNLLPHRKQWTMSFLPSGMCPNVSAQAGKSSSFKPLAPERRWDTLASPHHVSTRQRFIRIMATVNFWFFKQDSIVTSVIELILQKMKGAIKIRIKVG